MRSYLNTRSTNNRDSKKPLRKRASRASTSRSYAARSSPQPKSTPNYDTKKIDLHKLAEQVETNTLLQQSFEMKINELQSMVTDL